MTGGAVVREALAGGAAVMVREALAGVAMVRGALAGVAVVRGALAEEAVAGLKIEGGFGALQLDQFMMDDTLIEYQQFRSSRGLPFLPAVVELSSLKNVKAAFGISLSLLDAYRTSITSAPHPAGTIRPHAWPA